MHSEDLPQGYLVRPDSGTHPGVVMIHDVWGLADHTRDLATRLAGEGFAVLAVDLYRRVADLQIDDPGAWMRGLSDVEIAADLQESIDLLAGHAFMNDTRPEAYRPEIAVKAWGRMVDFLRGTLG